MKLRKHGIWAILLGLSLPVWAVEQPGAISGYVRNDSGTPQMGAVVQILGAANRTLTVFTDAAGYYTASGLLPGLYSLKVTAPSFLPALREKVGIRSGASLTLNVTLSTLLGVMQLGPARLGFAKFNAQFLPTQLFGDQFVGLCFKVAQRFFQTRRVGRTIHHRDAHETFAAG